MHLDINQLIYKAFRCHQTSLTTEILPKSLSIFPWSRLFEKYTKYYTYHMKRWVFIQILQLYVRDCSSSSYPYQYASYLYRNFDTKITLQQHSVQKRPESRNFQRVLGQAARHLEDHVL